VPKHPSSGKHATIGLGDVAGEQMVAAEAARRDENACRRESTAFLSKR
jgi:hypothetical protein